MYERTEKEQRVQRHVRKRAMQASGGKVPKKSRTMEAKESYRINSLNRTCNDCNGFVVPKVAKRRFREVFRAAQALQRAPVTPNPAIVGFNGKCACGALLICE